MDPDDRSRAVMCCGDALRAARRVRSRRRRSIRAVVLLIAAIGATIALPPRPRLLWNASASTPMGLYSVAVNGALTTGDMVVADLPTGWRRLAAVRHYIPLHVPLVKRIAAEPGDTVCATGSAITINGHHVVDRQSRDWNGRPMPWWRGCRTLRHGVLFLLGDDAASFDSRYFGPVRPDAVIGRASPLWTW